MRRNIYSFLIPAPAFFVLCSTSPVSSLFIPVWHTSLMVCLLFVSAGLICPLEQENRHLPRIIVHAFRQQRPLTLTEGNEVDISWNRLREIDRMLTATRDATQKFRDVQEAYAAGYKQEGPNRPGEGTHFINRRLLDTGVFDPTQPTFLLYEHKPDWSYELVGVGWLLPKSAGEVKPPLFFSPLAAWHYHQYPAPGLCIWKDGTTNPMRIDCLARGGRH
jgi:hypothetical protein